MASVKTIMSCTGVDIGTSVSVLFHFLGFFRQRVPEDPCSTGATRVSLLDQVKALQGKHIHLNIIRVGSDRFTDHDNDNIDSAIFTARKIFGAQSLAIGRVEHYAVTVAEADGKHVINSGDEAEDLFHDWTIPNNALDVFFVVDLEPDWAGLSPVKGPCDKDAPGMNGLIGGNIHLQTARATARTLAHEIGHYLGLKHNHDEDECPDTTVGCNNLMAQTTCAQTCGDGLCAAVLLTNAQGNGIRAHCFVQDGC